MLNSLGSVTNIPNMQGFQSAYYLSVKSSYIRFINSLYHVD